MKKEKPKCRHEGCKGQLVPFRDECGFHYQGRRSNDMALMVALLAEILNELREANKK